MIYVKCQEKAIIDKTFLKNLNIITPYREPLNRVAFALYKESLNNKTEDKMINWFDMPAEGLSNGGLFEVKELEVTENGTYEEKGEMYNKVTVNVEGGGGSSDFSTAEVTIIPVIEGSPTIISVGGIFTTQSYYDEIAYTFALGNSQNPIKLVIPKELENIGVAVSNLQAVDENDDLYIYDRNTETQIVSFDGNAEIDADTGFLIVTGDCTITVEMIID